MAKHSLTLRLWLPMAALILIPILLLNVAISQLLYKVKQDTAETCLGNMSQASSYLGQLLLDSQGNFQQLARDKNVDALRHVGKVKSLGDYHLMIEAKKSADVIWSGDYQRYWQGILFLKNDIFLTSTSICGNLEQFYGATYKLSPLSFADWKEQAAGHPNYYQFYTMRDFIIGSQNLKGLLYTMPLTPYGEMVGFCTFPRALVDQVLEPLNTAGGFTYIIDRTGQLLYQSGDSLAEPEAVFYSEVTKPSFLPKGVYGPDNIAVCSSLPFGLQIITVNPQTSVYETSMLLQKIVIVLNISIILALLFITWVITVRKTGRLRATLELLPPPKNRARLNLYERIDHLVSDLQSSNRELMNEVTMQVSILKDSFWERVFDNRISSEHDLREAAKIASLDLQADGYCILLMLLKSRDSGWDLERIGQIRLLQEALVGQLEENPKLRGFVHAVGMQQIAVVVRLDKEEAGIYRQRLSDILPAGEAPDDYQLVSVLGKPFESVQEFYYQYSVCRNRMNSAILSDGVPQEIIWCEDAGCKFEDDFYLPEELEERLLSGIRVGEFAIVKECFHLLVDHNFINRSLSPTGYMLFLGKIKLLLRDAYVPGMPFSLCEACQRIDGVQTDALLISCLLSISRQMCDFNSEHTDRKAPDSKENILTYIDGHYLDPDFSLLLVASHFHFSESYFSKLFKDYFKENFSSYTEQKLMQEADRLILQTDMTVEELARRFHYTNANSFRRAYKRFIGVTPSKRRETRSTE